MKGRGLVDLLHCIAAGRARHTGRMERVHGEGNVHRERQVEVQTDIRSPFHVLGVAGVHKALGKLVLHIQTASRANGLEDKGPSAIHSD